MSLNIPRRLDRRDPRRDDDVAEALRIMQEIVGITVSPETRDELMAFGIRLPRSVRISKRLRADDLAIGPAFLLERGPILPDNVILTCDQCRGPIQFRPHLAYVGKKHLCIFCACDLILQDYWKKERSKP